ncbi:uncharacterized protein LOC126264164 [Aethina tumida]|uniref:uncharacterized protein LOC126264164 n=1 Tax=Aethina tumida TaxID=116153 RepID=UPI002148AF4C|nr:uncharacterized protein LOC126264164 [Aethina tumida]
MLKYVILLCCLVAYVYCGGQSSIIRPGGGHDHYYPIYKKKKHHFPYHLIYAGFTYLTFLAIKFKLIFFFGTIFAVLCAGAKVFAFLKYLNKEKTPIIYDHDHGPEKIYIQAPSHGYSAPGSFAGPPGFDGSFSPYSAGPSVDHPPPGADTIGDSYGPPSHGRSANDEEADGLFERYETFARMMKKVNLTELAFDSMHLTSLDCKRRFVCESDYRANNTIILKAGYDWLNDEDYNKYKTTEPVSSEEECAELYPDCPDYEKKVQM